MMTSSQKIASCRRRPLSLWMVSFLAIVFASFFCLVAGQEQMALEELQVMTDEELEHICLTRGFELVKDDVDEATGEIYTLSHDDFVEAAQRCLAIEEEMNEILAEHPELAEELEAEIARMEEEQAQKQAEIQGLQQELEEKGKSSDSESSGAAFVPKPRSPEVSQTTGTPQDNVEEGAVPADKAKPVEEETVKAETMETPRQQSMPSASSDGSESQMEEPSEKSKEKEDLDLSVVEIIRTMLKETERDIKRIFALILPVVRPAINAGDVAWRHIKTTVISLLKDFDKMVQHKKEEQQRQESGEAPAE